MYFCKSQLNWRDKNPHPLSTKTNGLKTTTTNKPTCSLITEKFWPPKNNENPAQQKRSKIGRLLSPLMNSEAALAMCLGWRVFATLCDFCFSKLFDCCEVLHERLRGSFKHCSSIFLLSPQSMTKWSNVTPVYFQMGWNHQLESVCLI